MELQKKLGLPLENEKKKPETNNTLNNTQKLGDSLNQKNPEKKATYHEVYVNRTNHVIAEKAYIFLRNLTL